MGLKSKEDYKRAVDAVGNVINAWDPYCLLRCGAPEDEFDPEVRDVVVAISTIRTPIDAANAISKVFSKWFGSGRFRPEDCISVGQKLYEELVLQGLIANMPDNHRVQTDRAKPGR